MERKSIDFVIYIFNTFTSVVSVLHLALLANLLGPLFPLPLGHWFMSILSKSISITETAVYLIWLSTYYCLFARETYISVITWQRTLDIRYVWNLCDADRCPLLAIPQPRANDWIDRNRSKVWSILQDRDIHQHLKRLIVIRNRYAIFTDFNVNFNSFITRWTVEGECFVRIVGVPNFNLISRFSVVSFIHVIR